MKTYKNLQELISDKEVSKEIKDQIFNLSVKLIEKTEKKELSIEWLYIQRNVTKIEKMIESLKKMKIDTTQLEEKLKLEKIRKNELEKIFKKKEKIEKVELEKKGV